MNSLKLTVCGRTYLYVFSKYQKRRNSRTGRNLFFSLFLAQPLFTQVPPRKLTAKLGESLTMVCKATTSRVTWRKVNESLPQFRTTSRNGRLHIRDLQLEDSGVYECKVSSSRKSLRRSVDVLVVCEYH
jgi:hypothetical protein